MLTDKIPTANHHWTTNAVHLLAEEKQNSSDTPLIVYPGQLATGIRLYLKDESAHGTGSLKHRLARSLFLHALCSGRIQEGTRIVEASSGSTAVSDAYFAQLLGLPFTAVMPVTTSQKKVALIESYGGNCHFVEDPAAVYPEANRLSSAAGTHFMDQFFNAERATNWFDDDNIAASAFKQMCNEGLPEPSWVVVGAGTGGTAATFGRYARRKGMSTQLCIVDPENSAFFDSWKNKDPLHVTTVGSRIEGIGRQRAEPSFIPELVDEMIRVPDAASIAAARYLSDVLGRPVGGSTGTNFWGALILVRRMEQSGETGSIVTLICDDGERYADTYFNDQWISIQSMNLRSFESILEGK